MSGASYVGYNLSGQKLIKNAKNGPIFEKMKFAVKQCYQTFRVIFKQCGWGEQLKRFFLALGQGWSLYPFILLNTSKKFLKATIVSKNEF